MNKKTIAFATLMSIVELLTLVAVLFTAQEVIAIRTETHALWSQQTITGGEFNPLDYGAIPVK